MASPLYAILSDIHGNYEALKAVSRDARRIARQGRFRSLVFISLGDVVDYGPQPNECMNWLARAKPIVTLQGNHDAEATASLYRPPTRVGAEWWPITFWTRYTLKPMYRDRLASWPGVAPGVNHGAGLERFLFFHSDPWDQDSIIQSPGEAQRVLEELRRRRFRYACFGHTHFQMLYIGQGRNRTPRDVYAVSERTPMSESAWPVNRWHHLPSTATLLNPGSVGQPRAHAKQPGGDSRASYLLLYFDSSDGFLFQWRRVPYNVEATVRELCALRLPSMPDTGQTQGKDVHHGREHQASSFMTKFDPRRMAEALPQVTRHLARVLLQRGGDGCSV